MKKILYFIVSFLVVFLILSSTTYAIDMTNVAATIGDAADTAATTSQNVGGLALTAGLAAPLLTGYLATMATTAIFSRILLYYINEGGSGCWFCSLYTTAFDVINTIATQIYNQLAPIFLSLMAVCGALWIAMIVLQYFTTLNVPNTGEFMTRLFKAIGRMVVGAAILTSSVSFLFSYTINPIMIFSGGLSTQILNSAGISNGFVTEVSKDGTSVSRTKTPLCTSTNKNDSRFFSSDNSAKALSPEAYDATLCMLKTMSLELIFGMAVGATFISYAFLDLTWGIPNFYAILVGILVFVGYFGLFILFPFKLIDLIVRLGFVVALTPLYVVFWVFPVTREYLKRGWDMLVTAMFTLVALSVLMVIAIRLLTSAMKIDQIVSSMATGKIKEALQTMSLDGTQLFVTLVATWAGWKIIGMATSLGSAFGGSSQSTILGDAAWKNTVAAAKIVKNTAPSIAKAGISKAETTLKDTKTLLFRG